LAQPGILAALCAALLFGSGTPLAKILLEGVSLGLMAALLYFGSGLASLYTVCCEEVLRSTSHWGVALACWSNLHWSQLKSNK
jgi:hypothetical protein